MKNEMMPVHIILEAGDYQMVRTIDTQVHGNNPDKDPGAEFTKFGWTMYGQHAGSECTVEKQFCLVYYRCVCVAVQPRHAGVTHAKSESAQIREDFLEQLTRNGDSVRGQTEMLSTI